jgi:hypothetical protein
MTLEEAVKLLADEIEQKLPQAVKPLAGPLDIWPLLLALKAEIPPVDAAKEGDAQRAWEVTGLWHLHVGRVRDALAIHKALYLQMIDFQQQSGERCHKGVPLCWMGDEYLRLGYTVLAKRSLMLTLIEDAISNKGVIDPAKTGVHYRLRLHFGMSPDEIDRYGQQAWKCAETFPELKPMPEGILQELDDDWRTEMPSADEANFWDISVPYVRMLRQGFGTKDGKALEVLAEYLMASIPGARVSRRVMTHSTDLDVVCALDGAALDFRSELGRYVVCECKDWDKPVDFTAFAKFCRVLDSVKARFGILFSRNGISGEHGHAYASREQLKVFQDREIVIVVIDDDDLDAIEGGRNFIAMLRRKYEHVRLDMKVPTPVEPRKEPASQPDVLIDARRK